MTPEELFAVLDITGAAVFGVTMDQTIVYWNAGAAELLGYGRAAVIGRKCYELPAGLNSWGLTEDCSGGCGCLRSARQGMLPGVTTLVVRRGNGERKRYRVCPVVVGSVDELETVLFYCLEDVASTGLERYRSSVLPTVVDGVVRVESLENTGERRITRRESEVLRLVAMGWGTERIAEEMGVTVNTVRNHTRNVREKLDAGSRLEAVMTAMRLGLLEMGPSAG